MSTAPIPGGLRPALAAGPTHPGLVPHAILASAPRTARGRSFAMAACVYLLLGGGAVLAARMAPQVLCKPTGPTVGITLVEPSPAPKPILETHLDPRPEPAAPAALALGTGTRPESFEPRPQVATPAGVPDTPNALPTGGDPFVNRFTPDMPVGPNGTGGSPHGSETGTSSDPNAPSHSSGTGAPVEFDYSAIRILSQVTPVYPPVAKLARLQGPVELLMTIDERGVPVDVQVVSGLPAFRAEAVRAAQQWRFAPAHVGGQAVPARFRLSLNFVLR